MNNEEKIIELLTEIRDSLKKPKAVKRFVPPSISEVEQYLFDNKFKTVAEDFINFYESKNWMVGRNKMKDWKAAIRTWERTKTKKEKSTISKLDWQINEWQKAKKLL